MNNMTSESCAYLLGSRANYKCLGKGENHNGTTIRKLQPHINCKMGFYIFNLVARKLSLKPNFYIVNEL